MMVRLRKKTKPNYNFMKIPYSKQTITNQDISSVVKVLRSDFITQGPTTELFEKKISKYCGSKYSISTNSATSALHIACLSLNVGKKDIVWTSPNSFVASSNCAIFCGASIDFVDIDSKTYNISITSLEDKLAIAKKKNKLPKVLIVVHFAGNPCDMEKIFQLSKKYNFKIIEDASHALGTKNKNFKVGSCKYSNISVFSFHPVKTITTAEGGIATTNSFKIAKLMRLYRTHGITKIKKDFIKKNNDPWFYEQQLLGFNYRMNDLEGALGISQLKNVDKWVKKRNYLADIYDKEFSNLPLKLPLRKKHSLSSVHLYVVKIDKNKTNLTRRHVFNKLKSKNIMTNVHYIPIHMQPYYRKLKFKIGDFPVCEEYYKYALSLPMYPGLKLKEQKKVIEVLKKIFNKSN